MKLVLLLLLTAFATATPHTCGVTCDDAMGREPLVPPTASDPDADGDGFPASSDCNDDDPTVHPTAPERCGDGIDNNCNGGVDEEDACAATASTNVWVSGSLLEGPSVPAVRILRSKKRTLVLTLCCGYRFHVGMMVGDDPEGRWQSFLDTLLPTTSSLYPHREEWITRRNTRIVVNGTALVILLNPVPGYHVGEVRLRVASLALDCKCPHALAAHPRVLITPTVIPNPLALIVSGVDDPKALCPHTPYKLGLGPQTAIDALPLECFVAGSSGLTVTLLDGAPHTAWVVVDCGDAVANLTLDVAATPGSVPAMVRAPRMVVAGTHAVVSAVGKGEWSVDRGAHLASMSSPTTTVSGLIPGTTTATWTVRQSNPKCRETTATAVMEVHVPTVEAWPLRVCADTVAITADVLPEGLRGQWRGPVTSPLDYATTLRLGVGTTENTAEWVVDGDGGSQHVTRVTVVRVARAEAFAEDITITSAARSVKLRATLPDGAAGRWVSGSSDVAVSNASDPMSELVLPAWAADVGEPTEIKLTWTVQAAPCESSEVTVTVRVVPSTLGGAHAGGDVCTVLECVPMGAAALRRGETGQWSTSDPAAAIERPTDPLTTLCGIPVGRPIVLTWTLTTSRNGDVKSDDVTVYRMPPPVPARIAFPTLSYVVVAGPAITLRGAPPPLPYEGTWYPVGPIVTGLTAGHHNATWRVADPNSPAWCRQAAEATVFLEVVMADGGETQYTCGPTATIHAGEGTLPGTWSTTSPATIARPASHRSDVSGVPIGSTSAFRWTVSSEESGTVHYADAIVVRYEDIFRYRILTPPGRVLGRIVTLRAVPLESEFFGRWNCSDPNVRIEQPLFFDTLAYDLPPGRRVTFTWVVADRRDKCVPHTDRVDVIGVAAVVLSHSYRMCDARAGHVSVAAESVPQGVLGVWALADGCDGATLLPSPHGPHVALLEWPQPPNPTCTLSWTIWDENNYRDTANVTVAACPEGMDTVRFIGTLFRIVLGEATDIGFVTVPVDYRRAHITWEASDPDVELDVTSHSVVRLTGLQLGVPVVLTAKVARNDRVATLTVRRESVDVVVHANVLGLCDIRRGVSLRFALRATSTVRWADLPDLQRGFETWPGAWWHGGALKQVYMESACLVVVFHSPKMDIVNRLEVIPGHAFPGMLFHGVSHEERVPIQPINVYGYAVDKKSETVSEADIVLGGVTLSLVLIAGMDWGAVATASSEVMGRMLEVHGATASNWASPHLTSSLRAAHILHLRLSPSAGFCSGGDVTRVSVRIPLRMVCDEGNATAAGDDAWVSSPDMLLIRPTLPSAILVDEVSSSAQHQRSLERGGATLAVTLEGNSFTMNASPEIILSHGLERYRTCLLGHGLRVERATPRRLVITIPGACDNITIEPGMWIAVRIAPQSLQCEGGPLTTPRVSVNATRVFFVTPRVICDAPLQVRSASFDVVLEGDVWHSEAGDGTANDVNRALVGGMTGTGAMDAYLYEQIIQPMHLERASDTVLRFHMMPWASVVITWPTRCFEELTLALPSTTTLRSIPGQCVKIPDPIRVYSILCVEQTQTSLDTITLQHPCSGDTLDVRFNDTTTRDVMFRGALVRVAAPLPPPAVVVVTVASPKRFAWLTHAMTIGALMAFTPQTFHPTAAPVVAMLCVAFPEYLLHVWWGVWAVQLWGVPSLSLLGIAGAHGLVYVLATAGASYT